MEVDLLAGVIVERDEQKKRYMLAYRNALELGNLSSYEQGEFERIDAKVCALTTECREKEIELAPLLDANKGEYIIEMIELVDYEAKKFSELTGKLLALVRDINLRRASTT